MAVVSTLEVLINGSNAGLRASLRDSDSALGNFVSGVGSRLQSIGAGLTRLGGQITLLTAPAVAFGVQGVAAAMTFEDALTEIQARTGLTADEMDRLQQTALDLGAATPFSGSEVLSGMLQLLTAGQSVSEMYATLPAVLDAAAASGMDLGRTADSLTDIMLALGLPVERARDVVDALSAGAGASSATVEGLFQGFQNLGGAASAFGISMEDQVAILSIFNDTGIKGAEAGTQLRSMLRMMNSDTDRAAEAWERLGTSMFDANGNVRPFTEIFAEAQQALSGMTDQERLRTIQDVAGAYGQMGFLALTSATSIDEMRAKMEGQSTAAVVAQAKMGTFSGRVETLKGAIQSLQTKAFTPFMKEVLEPLVIRLTETIGKLTEWAEANPETVKSIIEVVGAVAGLGAALVPTGMIISTIGTAVSAFGALLGSPILVPLAALVGGVLVLADTLNLDLGAGFGAVGEQAQLFMARLGENGLGAALLGLFTVMEDGSSATSTILQAFGVGKEQADAFGQGVSNAFQGVVSFIQDTALPGLQRLADWFTGTVLPGVVSFVETSVMPIINGFVGLLGSIWATVSPALGNLGNWFLNDVLPLMGQTIQEVFMPAIQLVVDILTDIWEIVGPPLGELANWFTATALPAITDFLSGTVVPILSGFIDLLRGIWDAVRPGLESLFNWLRDRLAEVVGFIQSVIDAWNRLTGQLGAWGGVGANANVIGQGLQNGQWNAGDVIGAAWGAIRSEFGFAEGGLFPANQPILVGERGPEIVNFGRSGSVTSNDALRGQFGRDSGGLRIDAVYIQLPAEALRDPAAARRRGEQAGDAFLNKLRERGGDFR